MRTVEIVGEEQNLRFVNENDLSSLQNLSQNHCIKTSYTLFSRPSVKPKSKHKGQVTSLTNDGSLFFTLVYISSQTRHGNLDQFFTHENQTAPPSLSLGGKLRLGTKGDILHCLEKETPRPARAPVVNGKYLDDAAIVQRLNPGAANMYILS